ncbi:hypothetical protein [Agrobacterium larrymoorei]|uniref:Uncharacterized protein n=1 Tax=Agrobacterium larrymoorei TaxID=160699 RepID=A0AAF0KG82_9HYPH|nr:hypothetical protein [Agrobacterium larrymoorei]WHA43916.1 hypothetical protein CFBP5477_022620 [Agrobacterium larrymoorei]
MSVIGSHTAVGTSRCLAAMVKPTTNLHFDMRAGLRAIGRWLQVQMPDEPPARCQQGAAQVTLLLKV